MEEEDTGTALGAQLEAVGVPAAVAAYVEQQRPLFWISWLGQWGIIGLMLAGFAVGGVWLWPALERLTEANALAAAADEGALLVHSNFGSSLVIALFGWIFAAGAIVGVIGVMTPRLQASTFAFNMLNGQDALSRWAVARTVQTLSDESDPKTYVRKAVVSWQWWALGLGAFFLMLATYAVTRDVQAHSLFTRTHYVESPFLPWGSREPRPWSDVESVELGCNHVTGRNAGDDIVYKAHFRDGTTVFVDSAAALSGSWLEGLETIDTAIQRSGAEFRRWNWLGRDPLHPACLAVMQSYYQGNYPRIERLLRVGQLPGD